MTPFEVTLTALAVFIVILLILPPLRHPLVSAPLMKAVGRVLPKMSDTERIALEAGTVWWDGEIFSGNPDWSKLLDFQIKPLSEAERAFIDGPLEQLCQMLDDWQITQDRDLPPEIWAFLKEHKFLGMIIPEDYGGLGFSAHAHSAVVARLSSRSVTAAITVMVPNSLGPCELLLHYGTKQQREFYLPRLANGTDIPCFALSEAEAGSDAANGQSFGIVRKGMWQGEKIIGMELTFNKRYITLAPVAGLIGLAFRLHDPDHHIWAQEDVGITCALLPRETSGLKIGRRHDPMGIPFQNGPVSGKAVFVPLDYIIGGIANAGMGWKMLMESLAAGRSISLPAQAQSAAELALRASSAYGTIREQFGLEIGKFEGIREKTAAIAGHTYFMNAARRLAFGAVDAGEKPSVVSAMVKAYLTEGARKSINDAMDIHAGAAICRGPANIYSRPYNAIPIGITVEGANILTRSLIVFGQGALRCHPYLLREMDAIQRRDVKAFDRAFFGHLNHVFKNLIQALFTTLTRGIFTTAPVSGSEAKYYKKLARHARSFALIADVCLATLGGAIKRKEYLSGRLSDAFAWMFLATATLKHFHDKGRPEKEKALLDWVCMTAHHKTEAALIGVLQNLPNRPLAILTRAVLFPFGSREKMPTDRQTDAVAESLHDPDLRHHLTENVFIPDAKEPGLGQMEAAYGQIVATAEIRQKINAGKKSEKLKQPGSLGKATMREMAKVAKEKDIISAEEFEALMAAENSRSQVIQVSDFSQRDHKRLR